MRVKACVGVARKFINEGNKATPDGLNHDGAGKIHIASLMYSACSLRGNALLIQSVSEEADDRAAALKRR